MPSYAGPSAARSGDVAGTLRLLAYLVVALTLVVLDHEYARLAEEVGCRPYLRAPAPGVHAGFIDALAEAVMVALGRVQGARPFGPWLCPTGLAKCACREGEDE